MKKNIAVITGGEASEVGISLKSAGVVCKHLSKEKYNVFKVVIDGPDWIVERDNPVKLKIDKNDFSFTIEGHKITFDAVFVAIHGTPAEDGKLQEMQIKVGDVVLMDKYSGQEINIEGEDYTIVRADDLIAIIEK